VVSLGEVYYDALEVVQIQTTFVSFCLNKSKFATCDKNVADCFDLLKGCWIALDLEC